MLRVPEVASGTVTYFRGQAPDAVHVRELEVGTPAVDVPLGVDEVEGEVDLLLGLARRNVDPDLEVADHRGTAVSRIIVV